MPYGSLSELPTAVKKLPKHAQEIYQAAFNSAYEEYEDEGKAAATAWAAVKKQYVKGEDGKWRKKGGKALSFDEITRRVRWAWSEQFNPRPSDIPGANEYAHYGYVRDVYEGYCIVEIEAKGLFSYPYQLTEMGGVEFGEPKEVEVAYQEKTLLERIAATFEAILQKVLPSPRPEPVRVQAGKVIVFRDHKTGQRRWIGVPSSAFYPDRTGEGFTTSALADAVERLHQEDGTLKTADGLPVYLDDFHCDPLVLGEADCVGMCGPFVVATGLEGDSRDAKCYFDWLEEHPDTDERMSILFDYPETQKTLEGVYTGEVNLLRFTVAPAGVVANPVTAFLAMGAKVGGETMKIDPRARERFIEIYGEERVAEIESQLEVAAEKATDAGLEQKTTAAEEAVAAETSTETAPETSPVPPEGAPEPAEEAQPETTETTETPSEEPDAVQALEAKVNARLDELNQKIDSILGAIQAVGTPPAQPKTEPAPAPTDASPSPLSRRAVHYPAQTPATSKSKTTGDEAASIPAASPLKSRG